VPDARPPDLVWLLPLAKGAVWRPFATWPTPGESELIEASSENVREASHGYPAL